MRKIGASIRSPRSRWGRRSVAAANTAAAVSGLVSGSGAAAIAAADAEVGVMMGSSEEQQENRAARGALSGPERLEPVPASLSLSATPLA